MGSRSEAVRKAWITRRGNMVRRKDIKAVVGRLAQYLDFRSVEGSSASYRLRAGRETKSQRLHRLGIARVTPLRGGLALSRHLSSLPKRVRTNAEIRKALAKFVADTPKKR